MDRYAVLLLVEALRYKPKVAGSITDGVIGIFHRLNPLALGSMQFLTKMSSRDVSWG